MTDDKPAQGCHSDQGQGVCPYETPGEGADLDELVSLRRPDRELVLTDEEAALLMRMSAATIDRKLAPERAKPVLWGRSHTKPGSLLKSQIPIRAWADWNDAVPGFVEIDLVGHEGGVPSGSSASR